MQVLSDQTWLGRDGSIRHDSVYNGEFRDGRVDRPDWSKPGFNDTLSAWITPEALPSPTNNGTTGVVVLQDMPPIRAGSDALHFEVTMNDLRNSYLNQEDIDEIKGASLSDGGVLKPVDTWQSGSCMRLVD